MAICKECDRCGKRYTNYNYENGSKKNFNGLIFASINDNNTRFNNHGIQDLCPECFDDFKEWWDRDHIMLSDEQVKDWENRRNKKIEKALYDEDERTDTEVKTAAAEVVEPIIQEPESDGEKYGEPKMG